MPISYQPILSKDQLKKSYTFLWSDGKNLVLALTRAYYYWPKHLEIDDVWLQEKCRGVSVNGNKLSFVFMKRVIAKIWKLFPDAIKLSLIVAANNIAAIKLYEKLGFEIVKRNVKRSQLNIQNGFAMIRHKRSY